jgi:signal transduction histidine kinase
MPGPDLAAPATVMEHATAPAGHRLRWWGAVAGVALAVVDTLSLGWLGADFRMWGRDVTWLVALWFSGSLALVGFLLGDALEGRRRERAAAEALAAARARLAQSEKLAALGQLAAAVAHEVRNPLAVVRSAAQGLAETLSDGDVEGHRAAAFIMAEVDRLGSVVTSLLAFARPLHLSPRPIPVRDVITHAIELAGSELAAKGVRLRREEPPALSRVYADGDLVCQVLVGILANAAQAAPAGGEVTVTARAADGAVALAVADDGPGVPAEIRGRIFEPFFTTRARGTGLGLAVARQIVEAHGGRIEVGDREGGGARFTLTLPTGEPA